MAAWLDDIRRVLPGACVSTRRSDLDAAGRDESTLPAVVPDAVVWPQSTEQVAAVVRVAAHHGVPVTARGAGSSLEGNPIPVRRGLVADLSRMNAIVAVEPDDLLVRVQPGVVFDRLNQALRPHGLFFPPHPGGSAALATIGGMVANNASGIYSVKYGGTRDYVRAATVVTGSGGVLHLGNACRKVSSGYHLIGLLVGSEGTLAIATEICLSLAAVPARRERDAFAFPDEAGAAAAIAAMMRFGIDLAAVEYLDRRCVRACNALLRTALPEQPLILIELHGAQPDARLPWDAVRALVGEHGGATIAPASGDAWGLREHVTRAIQAQQPEASIVRSDLAFPVSRLPDVVRRCYELATARGAIVHIFGHAGLGIVHALILAPRTDAGAFASAMALKDELVDTVLALGGSVSGEHGLGLGNRAYAAREHGETLTLMRGIKALFDPKGILNPGKMWE